MAGPYREPKPLRDLIAPDRRRERALLLFGGGIFVGGLFVHFGPQLFARCPTEVDPPPTEPIPVVLDDKAPSTEPTVVAATLGPAEIERVVAQHRVAVRRVCWERLKPSMNASVSLTIEVAPNGDVVSVESRGDDPTVASCVEGQVRRWKFPAHAERSAPIVLPFRFTRAEPITDPAGGQD